MYTAFQIIIYVAAALFLIIFVRAYMYGRFKNLWKKSKADVLVKINEELSKKKGYKPFYFDNGKIVIWAKLHAHAKSRFLEYKRSKV